MTQIVPFKDKVASFRTLLDQMKPQLARALPQHVRADRMVRVVLTQLQRVPKLLDCSRESLLGCIVQAAQLGLEPDGLLGHAYLVPYGRTCNLIVGYRGMIKLARQSGEVSNIYAVAVHAKDEFAYTRGSDEHIHHVPASRPMTEDGKVDLEWSPGPLTHVYAVCKLKDGSSQLDVMDVGDVERIRNRSKAANGGPWQTDYEAMAMKTVLRRLCKMLPAAVELQKAVTLDEQVDAGLPQTLEDAVDITATEGEKTEDSASAS